MTSISTLRAEKGDLPKIPLILHIKWLIKLLYLAIEFFRWDN